MALDITFFVLVCLHLVLTIFPFLVSTAQFKGEFRTNRRSAMSNIAPSYWRYIEILLALRHSLRLKVKRGEFAALIRSFRGFFFICCALPTGGVRFAAPIVLAQHKGNRRIG
jgi:hypothetical protein